MQKNRVVIFLKNLDFFRLWNIIVIIERVEQQQLLCFSSCFFESIMCSEASFFSKKEKSLFNNFCANIINLPKNYHHDHDHRQIDNCIKQRHQDVTNFYDIHSFIVCRNGLILFHLACGWKKNFEIQIPSIEEERGKRKISSNKKKIKWYCCKTELFLEKFFSLNTEQKVSYIWLDEQQFWKGVELSSK